MKDSAYKVFRTTVEFALIIVSSGGELLTAKRENCSPYVLISPGILIALLCC